MFALQSGSNGNCIFVEAGGVRLLIDAGISGVQMEQRLAAHGVRPDEIDALLISHDHRDHAQCMGIYQRKLGIPVYVTAPTLQAARRRTKLGLIDDVCCFTAGESMQLGSVTVETIPTPHDGADGVAFVIDDGRCRLGVMTDLGHVFAGLEEVMLSLDAVLLESNYDPQMLKDGPYPAFLQERIEGPGGHLSNLDAAGLLQRAFQSRLRWACLGHLSEYNNHPAVALQTHRAVLGERCLLRLASRHMPSDMFVL
ncbi:MAG: MBL fold metallo-hydrolase [Planctomycetaceae bacterium]|nr:MBL fold metallo-hydrolase [Planctomycetaceae bacterium]